MGEAEHRCRRCGRTPDDRLMPNVVRGAAAPQLQPADAEAPPPAAIQTSFRPGVQARLFQDEGGSNVIQFPALGDTRRRRSPDSVPAASSKPRVRRARPAPEEQANLDFRPVPKYQARTLATTVDAVIHCDDPVAARLHRAIAAAFDWSLVAIGYALFLLVFRLSGGAFAPNRANLMALGGVLFLIACAYGIVCVVAGSETVGMRWAGLRLVTFSGFSPDPKQRLLRFVGSCLSVCTVVGLVWSLWDEERLTWQDHISGTFPTSPAAGTRVFQRR
jgi:uncharacterized RDD family membrane protein YckC